MEFSILRFKIVAKDELRLPYYKGSVFRGLFGYSLKKTVCVTKMSSFDGCLLRYNCPYAYIFETSNERNERVARPFVIEPPLTEKKLFPTGDTLEVNLILFGKAIEYIPYLVFTFKEMGRRGIGANNGKFWLQKVTQDDKIIYDFEEQILHNTFKRYDLFKIKEEKANKVTIHFLTPTAIKYNGKINFEIDFLTLIKAIRRRLKALSVYHNEKLAKDIEIDFEAAEKIVVKKISLEPFQWKRYSNRQQQKIDFSGFIGEMELDGNLTPFMPLLRMGEIVHVGRGTVYGMGKYVVEVLSKS